MFGMLEKKRIVNAGCDALTELEDLQHLLKSHRIHVWYIYLHVVDFYGKCNPMGVTVSYMENRNNPKPPLARL